jgi:hypothetical protein
MPVFIIGAELVSVPIVHVPDPHENDPFTTSALLSIFTEQSVPV